MFKQFATPVVSLNGLNVKLANQVEKLRVQYFTLH